jgi:TolB-like protein
MVPHPESGSSPGSPAGGTRLPPAEALRIAAQLTDTEEDLHVITRVVLALVGADDDLTGDAADAALAEAGIPAEARRVLLAASGPASGRPSIAELRAGLESAAVAGTGQAPAPERTGIARLFAELHGRRVTRTALWYVGGSVAVVEAANIFLPLLGAPTGIVRLLAILAVCGLPMALMLSWTFDVAPARKSGLGRWPRLALLGGVTAVSLAGATLIWRGGARVGTPEPESATSQAADPSHVAVLGFGTMGGDAELEAFATQLQVRLIDGLAAAAIGRSATRQLRVLSYAGVLPFTGASRFDSVRVARRVGTVLDGSVERTAGAVRVRVRLVDTETGYQLSSSVAEVGSDDRVGLLDAVADSVLRLVRTALGPVVRDHMRLLETRSQAAFDRLVWAASRLEQFDPAFNRADYETAEHVLIDADSMLAEAERLDPRWIEPIVLRGWLVDRHVRLVRARGDSNAVVPAILKATAHAERALALNPSDPRALVLRGGVRHHHLQVARPANAAEAERLRDAAEHDLRASLIGNHAPALPLRMLSELAGNAGRLQEALNYGARAYAEDPFMEQVQVTVFRLFQYSFASRQDSAAARWCAEGMQRFGDPVFHDCRLALAAWSDAYPLSLDSAQALVAAELSAYPAPLRPILEPRLHAMMAAMLARQGMGDSARVLLREARRHDTSPGVLRAAAGVFGLLGEPDSALATVRTLLRTVPSERTTLQNASELRPLARDARVRTLIETWPAPGH